MGSKIGVNQAWFSKSTYKDTMNNVFLHENNECFTLHNVYAPCDLEKKEIYGNFYTKFFQVMSG